MPSAPGNRAAIAHAAPDRERLAAERERVEQMLDALFELAMGASSEAAKVTAALAFMNRLEGPCRTMAEVAAERGNAPKQGGITVQCADE